MSTRRQLLVALGAGFLAVPLASLADKRGKVWRIGLLWSRDLSDPLYAQIPPALRELGYVEGRNLILEWRCADGQYDRLPGLAIELTRLPVDLIVTDGTPGVLAAQKATRTIPIVFPTAGDPIGNGLVKSMARPGGNTTGLALHLSDTSLKQLEMLVTLRPKLSRLAVLWNPANPYAPASVKTLRDAKATTRVEIVSLEARTPQEIDSAFAAARTARAEALLWISDSFLFQQHRQIADLAVRHRLPSISGFAEYANGGGLMGYGPNRTYNYRRAATYVDRILKGADPAQLPVEQPTKLDLVINRRVATALGLAIPAELLLQADTVIE